MQMRIWWWAGLCLILSVVIVNADTIYTWTDEEGVRRFSDQPPAEAADVQTIAAEPPASADPGARDSYLRMLEEAEQDRRRLEAQREQEAAEAASKAEEEARARRQARIDAERERLQRQIDELNKRMLGPYFSQGMRQAQIDAIQEKIDALEDAD